MGGERRILRRPSKHAQRRSAMLCALSPLPPPANTHTHTTFNLSFFPIILDRDSLCD